MTNKQPEALRLADQLIANYPNIYTGLAPSCANELRRQHARIAELEAKLASAQQAVQPVAWAAVYFAGPRMGKIYTTCDTEQQCNAYIAQVHQSNDSITLTAKPIYTHPTQQGMDAEHWAELYRLLEDGKRSDGTPWQKVAAQERALRDDMQRAISDLPRYTYGYKADEWGMNNCLQTYQDNTGKFLMRDEVLAALAAQTKQDGANKWLTTNID